MAKESIEGLIAKYNRLTARYRDLEQQVTEKEEKWAELEKEHKIIETLARSLCELILAKDPDEMKLGTEYSWSQLGTRDIIQRSQTSFANYNDSRTALLKEIQKQSEDRRIQIESLKMQVEQEKHRREQFEQLRDSRDDDISSICVDPETGEVLEDEDQPVAEDTKKRVAYQAQQAAESGDIALVRYDEDDDLSLTSQAASGSPSITKDDIRRGSYTPVTSSLSIFEEPKDVTAADLEQQGQAAKRSAELSIERGGRQITQAQKKVNEAATQRKAAIAGTIQVNLSEVAEKMTDRHWKMLEVVGTTGICEGGEIVSATIEAVIASGVSKPPTESSFRYVLQNLVTFGVFVADSTVKHPLKSNFSVYWISDIGRLLYVKKFGSDPVVSERDLLVADHDNMDHAIGIKALREILEASGCYTDVSMSRAANTIRLDDGTLYIPDIVAQGKSRQKKSMRVYMEYERNTHHQADFNIKLNKAVKVSRYVNIVCQNAATANGLKDKVEKWVESRGGASALPKVCVRITPLIRLKGKTNINDDDNWQVVFRLSNSAEPVIRK